MLAKITPVLVLAFLYCQLPAIQAGNTSVTDSDDALFHIECPDDVYLNCGAEIWDLTPYGWAYVHGYGNPVPAPHPVVHYYVNSCGSGHITRTWTAYDYNNHPHSCTQYIYVGSGGYSGHNIHWPPNYETYDCNGSLHPSHLPPPYDYPTYVNSSCSDIILGYEDLVFHFGGGCKKILRTWKAIDWCTYNPAYPHGGGIWTHTQVLKVKPQGHLMITCPDDITISAGVNCSGTYVSIPKVTGMGACGSGVSVTNDSPFANSNGADASGHYPNGMTIVTFMAEDACGNWESCKVKITVTDMKKPTPICYNGLTANLMLNHDGYYIDLDAKWFDKGSFDNCTPKHLLKFRIEPSRFTCDDLGEQPVRVYVKDADGNEQYCNTYVIIQDNMGMCPPEDTTTFSLSGQLTNNQGLAMSNVSLELSMNGDMINNQQSASSGNFTFNNVVNSEDYMIKPVGEQDYMLGLSTFDLLKLAKHVNGVKMLNTTGELFAADANQDGQVDILDLLTLRKLLLHYTTSLPNNKAWRFIPTDELMAGDDDMLYNDINEYWTIEDLYEHVDDIDFTGIKIGDINGSIQSLNGATERTANPTFVIKTIAEGSRINFVSTQTMDVGGLQMQLDLGDVTIESITNGMLDLQATHMRQLDEQLLISWFSENSVLLKKGDVLFSLHTEQLASQTMQLASTGLLPEVYSEGEVIYDLKLEQESDAQEAETSEVLDVAIFPNPGVRGESLKIICGQAPIKQVIVFDSKGQVQSTQNDIMQNEVNISTTNMHAGLYVIQVQAVDGRLTYMKQTIK